MKKIKDDTLNYDSALAELQHIVTEMQSGQISIDVIAEKVTRAQYLLTFCKDKLRNTSETLSKNLDK